MRAIFLDRDGTLTVGTPTIERVDSVDKVKLLPHTIEVLKALKQLDYQIFIITNQAGVSEGLITLDEFWAINQRVLDLIAPSGIDITGTLLCPHQESDDCDCRKPKPKLLLEAAEKYTIDLANSWMIGDRPSDVETGVNAGIQTILVKTGDPAASSAAATFTAPTLLEAARYLQNVKDVQLRTMERDITGAFIFSRDGQVLLGKTGVYLGQWVVAGGGVDEGETPREAVIREVKEELGLDIRGAQIEPVVGEVTEGVSQKVLRDTKERVIVHMKFNDFKITLDQNATDVRLVLEDDFTDARWFPVSELSKLELGGGARSTFRKLGYIS